LKSQFAYSRLQTMRMQSISYSESAFQKMYVRGFSNLYSRNVPTAKLMAYQRQRIKYARFHTLGILSKKFTLVN
jgi:hypothetical protein